MKQVPNRENYLKTKDRSTKTKEELHEEKKKLKKQKKDKDLMRQQRKKIRLREKLKINAQEQLHRLHKEHAKWVQSELKKDAILASGKHLGVEEMLFVVQARNSESCHPAYVNHVSDTTSRQVVPVHQIHPSMYGYTLTKRKRDWKIEAQQEEAQIEKNLLSLQLKQDKKAKKAKKLALKQAKINAANGNRKDRRDYAKQQEEMKEEIKKQKVLNQKKLKEKQKNEQKGKGLKEDGSPNYTPLETNALISYNGKINFNYSHVHPSYCGSKVLKKLKQNVPDTLIVLEGKEIKMQKAQPGTVLCDHPGCIHVVTMSETMGISKQTAYNNKTAKEKQELYDERYMKFTKKYEHQDQMSHPSWNGVWKIYKTKRIICNSSITNPIYFNRECTLLHPPTPRVADADIYEPPLRWGRPARCVVCQAPPGVLGRPGCPGCFESKARLPWTFPKRSLPEIYPPPFERDHGIVRLRSKRAKNKKEKESRRQRKAKTEASLQLNALGINGSNSEILQTVTSPTQKINLNALNKIKREKEKNLDLATQAGLQRAAKLANYHTPMIDRKAVVQHRRSGGIDYVTVWVKTIPGGTCVRLVLDKHETVERLRFLFLTNSGEYGPESWGYMVLPTDKGCYFLDSRVRYKSELRLGYRPGDRDLTEYGVGEKGGGEEVVILMVSAGGGRTELNLRTMSEMLRRYFFQNANIEHDEYGTPMHLPVNIIERVMKGRWGEDGSPKIFPGKDNSQKQLRRMCKNQLRIKLQAWEEDMEYVRQSEKRLRADAYREHLKRSLTIKMNSYKTLQNSLIAQQDGIKQEEMLEMIENLSDNEAGGLNRAGGPSPTRMTTTDLLRKGKRNAKKRRIENRLREVRQKEKRFIASTKARTLANHDEIPMYVFRKWVAPPPKPPLPPPPPRRKGILTRFAYGTYKYLLKPIKTGVVGSYRKIVDLRKMVKDIQNADEFEASSDEEEDPNEGTYSDDEMVVEEQLDVFAMEDSDEED